MIRSSGIGSSPMRSALRTTSCRTGSCGGSAGTTSGGPDSGGRSATRAPRPGTASHEDLAQRVFAADAPNQLWVSDLTEHWTDEGKLYVCAIKDLYSNRIDRHHRWGHP
jgi:transposase InsO family protein